MKRISRWTVYNAHYWKYFQLLKQCRADILIRGGNWQKSQPFAFFTNCMYFTLCFFFNLINWFIKDIYFFYWIRNTIFHVLLKTCTFALKRKKGLKLYAFSCTCITLLKGMFIYYHSSKINQVNYSEKESSFLVSIKTNTVNYPLNKLDIIASIRPLDNKIFHLL